MKRKKAKKILEEYIASCSGILPESDCLVYRDIKRNCISEYSFKYLMDIVYEK